MCVGELINVDPSKEAAVEAVEAAEAVAHILSSFIQTVLFIICYSLVQEYYSLKSSERSFTFNAKGDGMRGSQAIDSNKTENYSVSKRQQKLQEMIQSYKNLKMNVTLESLNSHNWYISNDFHLFH